MQMRTYFLPTVTGVFANLFHELAMHRQMAEFYFNLFAKVNPADVAPEKIATEGYPPLQQFYQQQAQYHQCRVLQVEAKLQRYHQECEKFEAQRQAAGQF